MEKLTVHPSKTYHYSNHYSHYNWIKPISNLKYYLNGPDRLTLVLIRLTSKVPLVKTFISEL